MQQKYHGLLIKQLVTYATRGAMADSFAVNKIIRYGVINKMDKKKQNKLDTISWHANCTFLSWQTNETVYIVNARRRIDNMPTNQSLFLPCLQPHHRRSCRLSACTYTQTHARIQNSISDGVNIEPYFSLQTAQYTKVCPQTRNGASQYNSHIADGLHFNYESTVRFHLNLAMQHLPNWMIQLYANNSIKKELAPCAKLSAGQPVCSFRAIQIKHV